MNYIYSQFSILLRVVVVTEKEKIKTVDMEPIVEEVSSRPAAVLMQFLLLYKRNLLIAKRSYVSTSGNLIQSIILIFVLFYR